MGEIICNVNSYNAVMFSRSSEGQVIVVMDGMKVIFRDPKHSFASDIPDEVLNFNAEVLEVRNGSLLVSFISAPNLFMPPVTGQCVVRTNPEILRDEIAVGDTVRVWFDGLVQEIYPPILPNVYRIMKEEFCIECSLDGIEFTQMRICHMWESAGKIRFGIYACSPESSSFKAVFTDMHITECAWKAHDDQQPG